MATGPTIPTDPIELLTNDLSREEPFLNKHWSAGLCGFVTFGAVCFGNWSAKKPLLSGIHQHALFTSAAVYIGHIIENYRRDYLAERDAVLRHYIQLHSDEFPIPERKKFGEILEPWIPIR
ncbi:NADH-ubiquinone oxidoreductase subunit b14.5b [Popillia japonica]|uniref:NADH dehydrogenase [ubiquinone] 1 subunit C2 n=1 Tax=Popillia japonica TaxID=7064 RepID=A0AAW1LFG4_POPJA